MKTLRIFYVRWMSIAASTIAALTYALPTHWLPLLASKYGNESPIVLAVSMLTKSYVIVGILWLCERFICKQFWKFIHPELDFSGKWKGYTTYTHVRIGNGPVPFGTGQEVIITQDCLNLRLVPSQGLDFTFKSRAIDIQDDGTTLVYAYHVEYTPGTPDRPSDAYGYESLDVTDPHEGEKPTKLSGWFAHCARDKTPVYEGKVQLFRQ